MIKVLLMLFSFNVFAAIIYITDEVDIPIRKDKTFEDNIIRSVPSGTKLNILQISSNGWTKVQFESTIGWVISRYLTNNPPARLELEKLKINNNDNKLLIIKQKLKIKNIEQQLSLTKNENKNNKIEILKSRSEKKHTEKTYQNSLKTEYENNKLKKDNLNLKTEIKLLKIGGEVSIENSNRTWFLYGGFLLLIGIIFGAIIAKNKTTRR